MQADSQEIIKTVGIAQQQLNRVEKKAVTAPSWVQHTKIKGDFRYRYESFDIEDTDDRERNRIRARRIAVGPQQGRKAFMIRTIRPLDRPVPGLERVAKANGLSLHAGVSCEGHQKNKRERLCRYIARPPVARAGHTS